MILEALGKVLLGVVAAIAGLAIAIGLACLAAWAFDAEDDDHREIDATEEFWP